MRLSFVILLSLSKEVDTQHNTKFPTSVSSINTGRCIKLVKPAKHLRRTASAVHGDIQQIKMSLLITSPVFPFHHNYSTPNCLRSSTYNTSTIIGHGNIPSIYKKHSAAGQKISRSSFTGLLVVYHHDLQPTPRFGFPLKLIFPPHPRSYRNLTPITGIIFWRLTSQCWSSAGRILCSSPLHLKGRGIFF